MWFPPGAPVVRVRRAPFLAGIAATLLSACTTSSPPTAAVQAAPASATAPSQVDEIARHRAFVERSAIPDARGTGPFRPIKLEEPSLPLHVVYRPAELRELGALRMPLYLFGNGACSDDGASARLHLLEIASYGYLAIAPGVIRNGPGVAVPPPPLPDYFNRTSSAQLADAIDWAVRENARPGSPYYGRIDVSKVAVSGHSCGGLQALQLAGDPRVSTFVIMNSGIYNDGGPGRSGIRLAKDQLDRIRVPILYVLGGPTDIAYPNGMDDFARLSRVPAAVVNSDVGHGGTFWEPNGGAAAEVVVAWLQWQLRDDQSAAQWFTGENCRLCGDGSWQYQRRNIATR